MAAVEAAAKQAPADPVAPAEVGPVAAVVVRFRSC